MTGHLDELDQPFLTIDIGQGPLDFQIDTAFLGTMLVGDEVFDVSHVEPAGPVLTELAGEQVTEFQSYWVRAQWLGELVDVQVLLGPGKECLLGIFMLTPHRLEIDWRQRTVELLPALE